MMKAPPTRSSSPSGSTATLMTSSAAQALSQAPLLAEPWRSAVVLKLMRFVTVNKVPIVQDALLDCGCTNVVYGVWCTRCNMLYLGYTGKQLLRAP